MQQKAKGLGGIFLPSCKTLLSVRQACLSASMEQLNTAASAFLSYCQRPSEPSDPSWVSGISRVFPTGQQSVLCSMHGLIAGKGSEEVISTQTRLKNRRNNGPDSASDQKLYTR